MNSLLVCRDAILSGEPITPELEHLVQREIQETTLFMGDLPPGALSVWFQRALHPPVHRFRVLVNHWETRSVEQLVLQVSTSETPMIPIAQVQADRAAASKRTRLSEQIRTAAPTLARWAESAASRLVPWPTRPFQVFRLPLVPLCDGRVLMSGPPPHLPIASFEMSLREGEVEEINTRGLEVHWTEPLDSYNGSCGELSAEDAESPEYLELVRLGRATLLIGHEVERYQRERERQDIAYANREFWAGMEEALKLGEQLLGRRPSEGRDA